MISGLWRKFLLTGVSLLFTCVMLEIFLRRLFPVQLPLSKADSILHHIHRPAQHT